MGTYKHSQITIYSTSGTDEWQLIPSRFLIIDQLAAYLSSKTKTVITNFQYIKPELEISITVDLSQVYALPLHSSYKYVSIVDTDDGGHFYYYFVKKVVWRAKSAVRFDLVMDVLNTFKEGTHYDFKASTRIIREHKNRFQIGPIQFTLEWSAASILGVIEINDLIKLLNVTHDNELICEARVISIDYDNNNVVLETIDGVALGVLQTALHDAILYNDYLNVFKDSYNYIEDNSFNEAALNYQSVMYRNIDYIPENINPILQCGNGGGTYISDKDKAILNKDWYLVYRNQNTPDPDDLDNPVECYLMPSTATQINSGDMTSGRLTAGNFDNSYYYVLITQADQVILDDGTAIPFTSGRYNHIEIYKNNNNTLTVTYVRQLSTIPFEAEVVATFTTTYLTLNNLPQSYYKSATHIAIYNYIADGIYNNPNGSWDNGDANNYIDSIDSLDRSDSKNIKIIKLPYIPYSFNVVNNKIDVPNSDWNYTNLGTLKVLKLNNLNTKLHNVLNIADNVNSNPLLHLKMGLVSTFNPSKTDTRRNYTYESKLYNSEFYRPTYVYDSFSFVMQLEKCRMDYYISYGTSLKIYFDVTRTINSRFMFHFDSYQLRNSEESYNNFMPINRNNEEVLYNVPYINYIRTGYNYDVKNRNLSNVSSYINVAGSAVSIGASLMAPSVPLKVAGVAASLVSLAMSAKNAIVTTIQNENSLKATLLQKERQTANVSGSDDVDLMSIYALNRLKLLYYTPNEVMLNMLNDLFFYAGYASNRIGKPSHNLRINFDYLECDAMIQRVKNIPDDCLEELINCFKNGVTYIHYVSTRTGDDRWDMKQELENWETIFF